MSRRKSTSSASAVTERPTVDPSPSSFIDVRKKRQSIGAYTSLFQRKLLPPLGFYREADKYSSLKKKFADDPDKLDALNEMWNDYKKYQVRKRFRWPPNLICGHLFWTTGYYADYQIKSRATKLRKPGEDSSEDEFINTLGQFRVAAGLEGDADIDVEEFERYREAKKLGAGPGAGGKRGTRFNPNNDYGTGKFNPRGSTDDSEGFRIDKRPTLNRLFGDDADADAKSSSKPGKSKRISISGEHKDIEEVETVVEVEYKLVKDPNKKKKRKSIKEGHDPEDDEPLAIPGLSAEDSAGLAEALAAGKNDPNKKVVSKKRSVAKTRVDATGQKIIDVEETEEPVGEGRQRHSFFLDMKVQDGDEYIPARHSLTTISTIWDTATDAALKSQYSTHTLTVSNLPGAITMSKISSLFPGAKVNLKTPKQQGGQPYATIRFKDPKECRRQFMGAQNLIIGGKKLVVNPKVKSYK